MSAENKEQRKSNDELLSESSKRVCRDMRNFVDSELKRLFLFTQTN